MIETERLSLRQLTMDDLDPLYRILSDPESMRHYPAPFTREKAVQWIEWNLENYAAHGFGLWAVMHKAGNRFLGDCGITMQHIDGEMVPEIGYHIDRAHTGHGYATEAARACRDYAFDVLGMETVYSYMKETNLPSQRVAEKNGMHLVRTYADEHGVATRVYAITAAQYRALRP